MHLDFKKALSKRIFYLPAFWLDNRLLSLLEINLLNESFPRAELPSAWQGLAKNLRGQTNHDDTNGPVEPTRSSF
jgi:hypothetical protein